MKRKRYKKASGKIESGSAKMVLIVFAAGISLVAIGLTIYGAVVSAHPAATTKPAPSKSGQPTRVSGGGLSSPAASDSPVPGPATLDMKELKVKVVLPTSLHDLEYAVVFLPGDKSVTSLGFGSKRLDAAGCAMANAPLGYLTYDADKGGQMVATVKSHDLYYLQPTSECSGDEVSNEATDLESTLNYLEADGR